MSQPYYGEIRMFAGNFAPTGWAFCDGQLLQIADYDVLFQLIGTTYGGDGQQNFAVPDLRGRIPIHVGTGFSGVSRGLAEFGGTEHETLTVAQIPQHLHRGATSAAASKTSPVSSLAGDTGLNSIYADGAGAPIASPNSTVPAGGSQPHGNLMPFLCVSFIISLNGIYPPQL